MACLETAIYNSLVIKTTTIDRKGKLYNSKLPPNLSGLIDCLQQKKDKRYTIIVKNLDVIHPIEEELRTMLLLIRRRVKGITFIEADEFNNHTELLKQLGLYFNQHNLIDMMEA